MDDQIQDAELLAELQNDPAGLGYRSGDEFKTTEEIASLLTHRQMVDNPEPRQNVPKRHTIEDFIEVLSPASAANIAQFGALDSLSRDIESGNTARIRIAIALLSKAGQIVTEDVPKIAAKLQETIPDPNWPAKVPAPCRMAVLCGSGFANHFQIDKVLNRNLNRG